MHLQLLRHTAAVSVYFDSVNNWVFADWHGDMSLQKVQDGCRTVATCFLELPCPCARVLNNNSDVTSVSADAPQWLATNFLPYLGVAGVKYLAWVRPPAPLLKARIEESVLQVDAPQVTMFDNISDAFDWLQHTCFAQVENRTLQPVASKGPRRGRTS